MKIGFSAAGLDPNASGVGRYAVELLRALLAEAPYHRFVLFVLERDRAQFEFAENSAQIISVPERFRSPARNFGWHQFALPRLARQLELDVLHVASAPRFVWLRPCALVGTVHELPAGPARQTTSAPSYRTLLAPLARRQDELVVPTVGAAQNVIRIFGAAASRVTVIPNGVDHQRFRPGLASRPSHAIARAHGIDPPFFLSVARLEHPAENHLQLIDAFNRFKAQTPSPWQLVLIGADAGGSGAIRETIRRSPYAPDIHAVGYVPLDRLPEWYRAAGVFVATGTRRGSGLAALEAMACGCPVMASAGSAAAELGDAAVLVSDRDDTDSLRNVLSQIAFDDELRHRLGFAAVLQAGRYTWQKTAAATLEVYTRAARRIREPFLALTVVPEATP